MVQPDAAVQTPDGMQANEPAAGGVEPAGAALASEDPIAGATRTRSSAKETMKDLMKNLRESQRSRPAMEIVRDALGDVRIKWYSDLQPSCIIMLYDRCRH